MVDNINKKIILSGGGTGGSVTPLLAVASELLKENKNLKLIFIGSKFGPEKELVEKFNDGKIRFLTIPSGKWRRYFSVANFFDVFKIISAFFTSLNILKKEQPALIMTAGSFIGVPLVWAATCLKIPFLVHQQDIRPGLANKLMTPFARAVTITFEKSFADYGPRAIWTGNPTAELAGDSITRQDIFEKYNLIADIPLVLVIGGGTGSLAINQLITSALPELVKFCQVVHLTGRGKMIKDFTGYSEKYLPFELLSHEEMMLLMSAADLVVSRCGLGALTALANLRKPAILIPMPDSHQEDNAAVFADEKAGLVISQKSLSPQSLITEIKSLLQDKSRLQEYSSNIGHVMKSRAAENIAALVWEIIGPKGKN